MDDSGGADEEPAGAPGASVGASAGDSGRGEGARAPVAVGVPVREGDAAEGLALQRSVRDLGIAAVPHGFRSSFRDWAAERTDAPHAVMEAALAHVVRNQVEAAYARSDLFERRRALMEQWAGYLAGERRDAEASPSR